MTLDEAIIHAKELATEQKRRSGLCVSTDDECDKFSKCIKCAEEHEQLAKWLEDYKRLKSIPEHTYDNCHNITCRRKCEKDGYNKAINDLVKEVCKKFTEYERNGVYRFCCCEIKQDIVDIAEKLKAGVLND